MTASVPVSGAVPDGWVSLRLKRVARLKAGEMITSESIEPEGPFPVFGGNGIRGYTDRHTHDGTFALIGRQGALCGNVNYASGRFWASEHAVVALPLGGTNVRWLGALLSALNLNQYSQSAAQPGLSVEVVENLLVPVPPLPSQRAIADYLDRETARIDVLIGAKRRMVELLEERRESSAATLVETLSVASSKAPLWSLLQLVETTGAPELEVLSVYRDYGVIPKASRSDNYNKTPDDLSRYQVVFPGDVVVNKMKAWQGSIGVSEFHGIVSPDYLVCRKIRPIDSLILHHVLRSPQLRTEFQMRSEGIRPAQWRLQWDQMRLIRIPVPDSGSQADVVTLQSREISRIQTLTTTLLQQVELLQGRRQALITAAVTGQLDIPDAA